MERKEIPERFFSVELHSKHQIKNMIIAEGEQKGSALIEGTIGNLI